MMNSDMSKCGIDGSKVYSVGSITDSFIGDQKLGDTQTSKLWGTGFHTGLLSSGLLNEYVGFPTILQNMQEQIKSEIKDMRIQHKDITIKELYEDVRELEEENELLKELLKRYL